MSLKSWKKEFYLVPANRVAKKNALAHSLRKWEGLTKDNLQKHKIEVRGISLYDTDGEHGISIANGTCALCQKFYDRKNASCVPCPLFNCEKQYWSWCNRLNPNPMIALIRRRDIKDYTQEQEKENERTAGQNKWLAQLRESLRSET